MDGTLCHSGWVSTRNPGLGQRRAVGRYWPLAQIHHVAGERRVPQPGEYFPVFRRVQGVDWVLDPIQGHPREDPGQAQAVIAVEVGDADAGDLGGSDPGEQHLPLGPLAWVKQPSLAIPPQQVAVVVAAPGRCLARRTQNHQFAVRHSTRPYATHTVGTRPGQS